MPSLPYPFKNNIRTLFSHFELHGSKHLEKKISSLSFYKLRSDRLLAQEHKLTSDKAIDIL